MSRNSVRSDLSERSERVVFATNSPSAEEYEDCPITFVTKGLSPDERGSDLTVESYVTAIGSDSISGLSLVRGQAGVTCPIIM